MSATTASLTRSKASSSAFKPMAHQGQTTSETKSIRREVGIRSPDETEDGQSNPAHDPIFTCNLPTKDQPVAGDACASSGSTGCALVSCKMAGGMSLYITGVTRREKKVDEIKPPMITHA